MVLNLLIEVVYQCGSSHHAIVDAVRFSDGIYLGTVE